MALGWRWGVGLPGNLWQSVVSLLKQFLKVRIIQLDLDLGTTHCHPNSVKVRQVVPRTTSVNVHMSACYVYRLANGIRRSPVIHTGLGRHLSAG